MYQALASLLLMLAGSSFAQSSNTTSNGTVLLQVASSGGSATSPLQYGLMFEDISHSGDGGIYAEMIQNRAFQGSPVFPPNLTAWGTVGGASIELEADSTPLSAALPNSVKVTSGSASQAGVFNTGWWGFSVQPQTYSGSFYVKGDYSGDFIVAFNSNTTGNTLVSTTVPSESVADAWTQHNFLLRPTAAAPDINNTFSITFNITTEPLNFNLISVFPPTYNDRPNGMRPDIMQALKDLNPSFLRFAGGNNIEGNDPPYYWKWNETVGPLLKRPGRPGTWTYENTDGLGLVEYLDWCEDLSMEPILAVWSGFYLDGPAVAQDVLQPYIQEALDMLEFIMGDPSTPQGQLRVSLGYGEAPLATINYVEVGNEDNLGGGLNSYDTYRFPMFYDAIKAVYPDMNIIASTVAISLPGDALGDYHIYDRPDDFIATQFNMFDGNTSAHRTFVGEYAAVQSSIQGSPTEGVNWSEDKWMFPRWIGSVSEAVFLIGTEINAPAMLGAAYAPMLQNMNSYQWTPDLISFSADPSQTTLSTSYHVIKLFSDNRLSQVLPVTSSASSGPAYWVAGTAASGQHVLKFAVYNATAPVQMSVSFDGVSNGATGQLTILSAQNGDPDASNSFPATNVVDTATTTVTSGDDGIFNFEAADLTVGVLVI